MPSKKAWETLHQFTSSIGLAAKIQHALEDLQWRRVTPRELANRLQMEWKLVETLLEKYQNLKQQDSEGSPEIFSLFIQAMETYQKSLFALGMKGNVEESLTTARQADDYLAEVDKQIDKKLSDISRSV